MEPRGRECGLREQGDPQILLGDRPAHGKDSHPSPVTVTSVRAPDSWRPKSISRPVLCWGRVLWDPRGAVFATIAQLRVSLAFSLPHQGFPDPSSSEVLAAPLGRGMEKKAPQEQLYIPPLLEGRKEGVWPLPTTSAPPSQLSLANPRLPRQAPRLVLAYLGVHTKLTGPRQRSHIVVRLLAPEPSPGPRRGAPCRRPHSSGGSCSSSVSSKLR